ncbi:hypothetical protein ACG2LH_09290 [Zhouia sp. PK063]|uniref:hypothetical protein n=1 Tax=Zhouia sp. PK063 TaxID=3373602 RepID=UPI00379D8810
MKKFKNVVLNRQDLQQIKGGLDQSENQLEPNCGNHGDACNTDKKENCCSGLYCMDYKCAYHTL